MRIILRFLAVVSMLVGGLIVAPTTSANANSASPYLGWRTYHNQCGNQDYFQLSQRGVAINRDQHNSGFVYYKHTQSQTGELRTNYYYENAVTKADRYYQCSGRRGYYVYSPTSTVHRYKYVNLNCFGLGCRLLYTHTTSWARGTVRP